MKSAAAGFAFLILALIALPLSSAHSPQLSNEVYAFSSQSKAKQSLYLEGNQSGMEMFKNWSIVIVGQGNYEVIENGSVLAKGYSSSSMVIPEIFNESKVSVDVFFNGVKYSFDNITIVNFLSSKSRISIPFLLEPVNIFLRLLKLLLLLFLSTLYDLVCYITHDFTSSA